MAGRFSWMKSATFLWTCNLNFCAFCRNRNLSGWARHAPSVRNVRLVAATNRDLDGMVASREFRSDLFYRLNVFPIIAPPLRERIEDVPLLVRYFAQKLSRRMNKQIETVPEESMNAMMRYRWPGNIRELENFVERAVILTKGTNLNAPVWELERETAAADGISNDPEADHDGGGGARAYPCHPSSDQLDHQRTERRCRPSWNEANNPPVPNEEAWDLPACATSCLTN